MRAIAPRPTITSSCAETTRQFWNLTSFYIDQPSSIDDKQLRGGPAVRTAHSHYLNGNISTDSRHAFVAGAGGSYYWDEKGGNNPSVNAQRDVSAECERESFARSVVVSRVTTMRNS